MGLYRDRLQGTDYLYMMSALGSNPNLQHEIRNSLYFVQEHRPAPNNLPLGYAMERVDHYLQAEEDVFELLDGRSE